MLTLEQLRSLKARNFSFIGMAAINAAIAEAEARQAAQCVPGGDLAAERAAIIIAENNAPALAEAEKILMEAHACLQAEIAAKAAADAQQAADELAAREAAIDAQIIAQGEHDTDTVNDPETMQ
jgi:hypothetical protein